MKEKFLEKLKEALITYSFSTKIPLVLLDENGETVYSVGNEEPFCKFFKDFTGEMNPCSQTHLYAAKQSEKLGEAYTFFCPAGLIHYTVPVIKKGIFRGSVLAGPILMEFSDKLMISEIMQKFNIDLKYLGMVESKIRSIQVIDPTRVRYLGNLLFIVAFSLLDDEKKELENRKLIAAHQSDLNEKIQDIKDNDNVEFYSYETEKELLLKVRNGDIIGAKNILNDMIGRILFASGGNINIIKSKTLELCTLLSRASIDGGADSNTIIDLNSKFLYKISNIKNIEDLSYWVIHMLDSFTQNVFNFNESKNPVLIQKCISYINEHYNEDINLETVANIVHLNPSYFSSIFKKEVGVSFSNYLNKIRIEQSKLMLKNTDSSIVEIALEVGFEDQSYFSKVFKNLTKMTPKQYRQNG